MTPPDLTQRQKLDLAEGRRLLSGATPTFRRPLEIPPSEYDEDADQERAARMELARWLFRNADALLSLAERAQQMEVALRRINRLRSNVIATQQAGWSNTIYPLVAILDAAGFEREEVDAAAQSEHRRAYGGAGKMPTIDAVLTKEPTDGR